MKVFVISDMEGVAGIVRGAQTSAGEPLYEEGRKLYTQEINAAVRGAKAAGATEIVVMDCHGAGKDYSFNSLIPEELDPDCELRRPGGVDRVHGVPRAGRATRRSSSGMHAMAGTPDGVMNHTIYGRDFLNLYFNGTQVGETGINAALCGAWGCPVLMVTGDARGLPRGQGAARRRSHDRRGQAGDRRPERAARAAVPGPRAGRGQARRRRSRT